MEKLRVGAVESDQDSSLAYTCTWWFLFVTISFSCILGLHSLINEPVTTLTTPTTTTEKAREGSFSNLCCKERLTIPGNLKMDRPAGSTGGQEVTQWSPVVLCLS